MLVHQTQLQVRSLRHPLTAASAVQWNLRALFFIATLMAIVITFASLFMLWCMLDSWSTSSIFHAFHLPPMEFGKIVMVRHQGLEQRERSCACASLPG